MSPVTNNRRGGTGRNKVKIKKNLVHRLITIRIKDELYSDCVHDNGEWWGYHMWGYRLPGEKATGYSILTATLINTAC